MSKLITYRGLPASGKTTDAYYKLGYLNAIGEKTMIVERDALRFMNGYGKYAGEFENTITTQQHALIRDGLKRNFNVISPDTNLNMKSLKGLIKIAEHYGAGVEIIDLDTPLDECIGRDSLRGGRNQVGEEVIRNFHNRYLKNGFPEIPKLPEELVVEPYVGNYEPDAYLVDLDGTTADKHDGRSYYDYSTVHLDKPHDDVISLLWDLHAAGKKIVYLSGRPESCRQLTEDWIAYKIGIDGELFMRPTGDSRADFVIKLELFDKHIRHRYNVIAAIDDRDQVVDAYRDRLGLRVYQVNRGDF